MSSAPSHHAPTDASSDYSTRIPLIARAITSCWISLVPSKIVWLTVPGFLGALRFGDVVATRCFAS